MDLRQQRISCGTGYMIKDSPTMRLGVKKMFLQTRWSNAVLLPVVLDDTRSPFDVNVAVRAMEQNPNSWEQSIQL